MRRRVWPRYLFWIVFGAILLGLSFYFDEGVRAWMLEQQTPGVQRFMHQVSRWGDWMPLIGAALVGVLAAYLLGSRRWIMIFISMIAACALAGTLNRVVKVSAGRSRPAVTEAVGWKAFRFSSKYNSFPSGHTASSTAFFLALFLARRRLGLFVLPLPLLIASSRLFLNAHHFSDVVGGMLLGILCAIWTRQFITSRMLDTSSKRRLLQV